LATRTRSARDELFYALNNASISALSELNLDLLQLAEELPLRPPVVESLLARIRRVKARVSKSRQGRERNWEFMNLVRGLVQKYWDAGGMRWDVTRSPDTSRITADGVPTEGKRSGDIVDFIFEIVQQLKPALCRGGSSRTPLNLFPTPVEVCRIELDAYWRAREKAGIGRAIENSLRTLEKLSKTLPGLSDFRRPKRQRRPTPLPVLKKTPN